MIAIIDYGINQTTELTRALTTIGVDFIVTHNEKDIISCEKVIISDASNLSKAIKRIHLFNLYSLLRFVKKPTLGISLGMDLLCNKSNDGISCLGLIETDVINDAINNVELRLPGLKEIEIIKENKLFENITNGTEFYFSNNYHVDISESTIAIANGESKFSAAIQKGNFYGVQFLPELSGEQGLQILKNFIQNIS
ncbi:MAG: imidazole glycerol phosphate synthase subunit HisH [Bacteroidetes bacterium]|nr:imidazole glycerol phosphate synthase subunit HisH [Bacteroidota bacterium]MBU1114546.1 imidazole glycerol phosphate synthase subunit HisH [Bacteroidota bacterium]MBU1798617.1 imidazole glycerol phosphate synthase subunit HisH [Bacteroidota bacterium]